MESSRALTLRSKEDVIHFVNSNPTQRRGMLLVFVALGGIFIDAYDFTSLSIGSSQITQQFSLSPFSLGFVTSIMAFGALVGALFGGRLSDKVGRNIIFLLDLILLVIAAFGAALAPNYAVLLIFRFLMGAGVGIDMPVALSFITEFSNQESKSRNVNLWQGYWYIATVSSGINGFILYFSGAGGSMWQWTAAFRRLVALIWVVLPFGKVNGNPNWAENH